MDSKTDLGSLKCIPYEPPQWLVGKLKYMPTHRIHLGNFPTPIQPWNFEVEGKKKNLLIKRDDFSEMAASGNKIRKLEFIFAEVKEGGHDVVLSIGGTQSNHCRSVSAIAARLGVPSAHVLRKDAYYEDDKPNVGNLLFHQLYGSKLFLVSKEEYVQKGQKLLLEETNKKLIESGDFKSPFVVPVGGSSLSGLFGYVEFIRELEEQLNNNSNIHFDEIIFSCGSGGTATGLVVGKLFCQNPTIRKAKLIGYGACDFPHIFHEHVNEMLDKLGVTERSEDLITFIQSKNLGYSINSPEEIDIIKQIAKTSGVILDTCYSGKAMVQYLKEEREEGKISLFIHTGGMFSIFGKPEIFQLEKKRNSY